MRRREAEWWESRQCGECRHGVWVTDEWLDQTHRDPTTLRCDAGGNGVLRGDPACRRYEPRGNGELIIVQEGMEELRWGGGKYPPRPDGEWNMKH